MRLNSYRLGPIYIMKYVSIMLAGRVIYYILIANRPISGYLIAMNTEVTNMNIACIACIVK